MFCQVVNCMNYIDIAIKEAVKAFNKNEVPIGAIIVKDNKIISKAYNKKNLKHFALFHAEILAIYKAAKKLKTWNLSECDLYVTLKPCGMCEKIIKESRINEVYYLCDKLENKKEYNKTKFNKLPDNEQTQIYLNLLQDFFKSKRK